MNLRRIIKIVWILLLIAVLFQLFKNGSFYFDFATSVIPGWHTTIYSPYSIYFILIYLSIFLILILSSIIIFKKNTTFRTIVKIVWVLLLAVVLFVIGIYLKVSAEDIPGWHTTVVPLNFILIYLSIVLLLILGTILIFRKKD